MRRRFKGKNSGDRYRRRGRGHRASSAGTKERGRTGLQHPAIFHGARNGRWGSWFARRARRGRGSDSRLQAADRHTHAEKPQFWWRRATRCGSRQNCRRHDFLRAAGQGVGLARAPIALRAAEAQHARILRPGPSARSSAGPLFLFFFSPPRAASTMSRRTDLARPKRGTRWSGRGGAKDWSEVGPKRRKPRGRGPRAKRGRQSNSRKINLKLTRLSRGGGGAAISAGNRDSPGCFAGGRQALGEGRARGQHRARKGSCMRDLLLRVASRGGTGGGSDSGSGDVFGELCGAEGLGQADWPRRKLAFRTGLLFGPRKRVTDAERFRERMSRSTGADLHRRWGTPAGATLRRRYQIVSAKHASRWFAPCGGDAGRGGRVWKDFGLTGGRFRGFGPLAPEDDPAPAQSHAVLGPFDPAQRAAQYRSGRMSGRAKDVGRRRPPGGFGGGGAFMSTSRLPMPRPGDRRRGRNMRGRRVQADWQSSSNTPVRNWTLSICSPDRVERVGVATNAAVSVF